MGLLALGKLGTGSALAAGSDAFAGNRLPSRPEVAFRIPEKVPVHFTPPALSAQKLGGLLGDRLQVNLVHRLLQVDEAALLGGFRQRPGVQEWIGEHVGKFLDAAARAWQYSGDPRLYTLMTRVAHQLIATQEPDGYLGTYLPGQHWTSWDVWTHKYDLLGLLAYYRATGDEAALASARKIGDLLLQTFGDKPGKRDLIQAGTHAGMAATSVLGPMVTLYRLTADERYLAFCHYIVRAIEAPNGPHIISSLRTSGSVYKTANAKAYEMISNLNGLVDLYAITAESPLLEAAQAGWRDIVTNRLYITGSTSKEEHFQDAGVLPGEKRDSIAETCVTVNWIELSARLYRLSGEPRYAEEIERSVFNHLLAAEDSKNGDFCYYTPLMGRKPFGHAINCCLSSGPRGISLLPELIWGRLENGLVINLYSPGTMTIDVAPGNPVTVTSATRFPRTGVVDLTIRPTHPANFSLSLRVPAWATSFTATSGGKTVIGKPGTYLSLERNWTAGSHVRVVMDLPVRTLAGGKSYPDHLAVARGPQILTFDRTTNPGLKLPEFAAVAEDQTQMRTTALTAPPDRRGEIAYASQAFIVQQPGKGDALVTQPIKLVPFAEARTSQVWLWRREAVAQAVSAEESRRAKLPRMTAFRTRGPMQIDGNLNEGDWQITTPAARVVRGLSKNRATFGLLWDDKNLYVGAKVVDDHLHNYGESGLANTDNVAVWLVLPSINDGQPIAIVQAWNHSEVGGQAIAGVQHAWAATADGYTVELAIPLRALGLAGQVGQSVRMDLCNTDSVAPPGKRNKLNWASPFEGVDVDPSAYGEVVFGSFPSP